MKITRELIDNLEEARRRAFPNYDAVYLTGPAVLVLSNLFLNPDCIADIDLRKFLTGRPVALSKIARHIVTAAPVTLCHYADQHQKKVLDRQDLIQCFGIDHISSVEKNHVSVQKSPSYALAHILTVGTVTHIRPWGKQRLANLRVNVSKDRVVRFKNVLIQ